MTDARVYQEGLEVTAFANPSDTRVAQTGLEVTAFANPSDARVAQTGLEVTVFAVPGDTRVAQQGLEAALYNIASTAEVYQEGLEVTTYGNPSSYAPCAGDPSGVIDFVADCPPPAGGITSTIEGYVPTPGLYVTPVCGAVRNLTAARTPAGRVILGWSEADDFMISVLDDYQDIFRDNSVGDDDKVLLFTAPGGLKYGSLWVAGGDLYVGLNYIAIDGDGRTEVYVADDPETPTFLSFVGTVDGENYNGGGVNTILSMGPVTVTRTGRWLLPTGGWIAYAGAAPSDASALYSSTDQGATWSVEAEHRRAPLFSGTTGPIANTVAQDPVTGYLYWSHYDGPLTDQAYVYESQDDGATWTVINSVAADTWQFYVDDAGTDLYAARGVGSAWRAFRVVDPTDNVAGFVDTGVDIINSRQGENFQFIKLGCVAAVIDNNRVAVGFVPPPAMYVGVIVMGDEQPSIH